MKKLGTVHHNLEGTVDRNMDIKSALDEVSDGNEEQLLKIGGKFILDMKWQRTCSNCVLAFCKK